MTPAGIAASMKQFQVLFQVGPLPLASSNSLLIDRIEGTIYGTACRAATSYKKAIYDLLGATPTARSFIRFRPTS
jgi:hypothetical protein